LNIHVINDIRQIETHTDEPLMPEPSSFEVQIAIEKLKRHKSPDTDKIPAEMIQEGGNTLCSEIHRLTNLILNKEELSQQWKDSIIMPVYKRVIKPNVVIVEEYHCFQLHTKFYPIFLSRG
jgi:hypothetical protein